MSRERVVPGTVVRSEDRPSLRVAYTPDSDDAFAYYAWESGAVTVDGVRASFHRDPIDRLNAAAAEERFDVVAVSSAYFPRVADRYDVLTVGNSVGRGCGPVLVSRRHRAAAELAGRRVGVGGHPTTGSSLALMFAPGIELVEMPFDEILEAVARDELAAGVMIHEEIVAFREAGLHAVRDLGAAWGEATGLPLPVGLNLVRRALGDAVGRSVATACERSLAWGLSHEGATLRHAGRFGRGRAREHLDMFRPSDTLRLPADARRAVREMADRVAALGLGPSIGGVRFVQGDLTDAELSAAAG